MIAHRLFAIGFFCLGGAAVAIGSAIFLLGPQAVVAEIFAPMLGLDGDAYYLLAEPNADNELRFYSVLWIAYGVIAIRAARALPTSVGTARLLLAIFFAGGSGRALSMATMGVPDMLFIILMWIELLVSPALYLLSLPIKPADAR
ncbi:MAG: DUF4345 domain-containing protein [Pseudomonadota bacterium]